MNLNNLTASPEEIQVHFIEGTTVEGVVSLDEFIEYSKELRGVRAKQVQQEVTELIGILFNNPGYTNIGKAISTDPNDNGEYIFLLERTYMVGEEVPGDTHGAGKMH